MIKLSIEEKAKAYDKALERAQALYNDKNEIGYANAESVLEEVFPLLKEPEDERIKKTLINFFSKGAEYDSSTNGIKDRNIIAWLEKQGREKPKRMISAEAKEALYDKPDLSEKDENVLEDIEEAIINYWHGDTQDILLDWLKSLRPQNNWKPSDEQMKQLGWIAEQNKDNMIGKELISLYQDLKKLREE